MKVNLIKSNTIFLPVRLNLQQCLKIYISFCTFSFAVHITLYFPESDLIFNNDMFVYFLYIYCGLIFQLTALCGYWVNLFIYNAEVSRIEHDNYVELLTSMGHNIFVTYIAKLKLNHIVLLWYNLSSRIRIQFTNQGY